MTFSLLAFYFLAAVTAGSALAVISVRNSVHAALFLVLTFFSAACIWLLAEAEFLAIALVLVYVGAVMVLFLFVVMMLDVKSAAKDEGFARYMPIGIVVAGVMVLEMVLLIGVQRFDQAFPTADPAAAAGGSNIEWLGRAMFTEYLYPFEIAAVILTVAIIAAIMITHRKRANTKHQDPSRQVQVQRADRVRLVSMPAEKQESTK